MGISDWFTVFGLLLAVYALYSSEERAILKLKLSKYDPVLLLSTVFIILVLIKYDDLLVRLPAIKTLNVSYGLHSSNWALIVFLILLSYFGWKLYQIPYQLPGIELILYYKKVMKRGFDGFFNLFNKYEHKASNKEYFNTYKTIIFDPVFIESNTDDPYFTTF